MQKHLPHPNFSLIILFSPLPKYACFIFTFLSYPKRWQQKSQKQDPEISFLTFFI